VNRAADPTVFAAIAELRARLAGISVRASDPCPTLDHIVHAFGLTSFERDVLLFLAGLELDPSLRQALPEQEPWPTFRFCLAALAEPHWSALLPDSPLRRWRLVETMPGPGFLDAEIRISERALHSLCGCEYLDPALEATFRLAPIMDLREPEARQIAEVWAKPGGAMNVIQISGAGDPIALAAQAVTALGSRLVVATGDAIAPLADDPGLASLWDRESALGRLCLLIDLRGASEETVSAAGRLLDRTQASTLVAGAEVPTSRRKTTIGAVATSPPSRASWSDIVLPEATMAVLEEIARHLRHRDRVYGDWGMAGPTDRGTGTAAVFSGPSGTGKTLAAEILANEIGRELVRIDLSQMVSKYIGETEKNLARLFDAAERSGAILLFDEADALFGKRSEVRDSHDRYANLEVSYLLQRMESHPGLAILTTNMKGALDPAFLRRIRFVANFPFPDAALREQIWRRAFTPQVPTESLDFERLARLNVAGGNIRNIALGAAFHAAETGEPVTMRTILRSARLEAVKLERPLNEAEVANWA